MRTFRRCLLWLLLAAPAQGQVAIPDTPAGENLAALLDAVNSGDPAAIVAYAETYGRRESSIEIARLAEQIGPLRVARILRSDRLELHYLLASARLPIQLLAMLQVEDADPPRLSFSLPWVPVPAGTDVIGFDVDATQRAEVVRAVAASLFKSYVLPAAADAMRDTLAAKLASGGYDDDVNGWVFANSLTRDLREVSDDKHLVVGFSPLRDGAPMAGLYDVQPMGAGDRACGFGSPETLEDGVRYLRIDLFVDPGRCAAQAMEALRPLVDANAVIFDVRDAVGGHAGMVTLILAHLLAEPVRLSSLHFPGSERVDELRLPAPEFRATQLAVYVLTSGRTFSAAEWFAYELKAHGRATLVGETTRGGAHVARVERIDERFVINLPYARPVSPITGSNWEGTGVEPDIAAAGDQAIDVALDLARATMVRTTETVR